MCDTDITWACVYICTIHSITSSVQHTQLLCTWSKHPCLCCSNCTCFEFIGKEFVDILRTNSIQQVMLSLVDATTGH
jgi:hypothetical protein